MSTPEIEKGLRLKTVVQLREECTKNNLPTNGNKAELIRRLKEHRKNEEEAASKVEEPVVKEEPAAEELVIKEEPAAKDKEEPMEDEEPIDEDELLKNDDDDDDDEQEGGEPEIEKEDEEPSAEDVTMKTTAETEEKNGEDKGENEEESAENGKEDEKTEEAAGDEEENKQSAEGDKEGGEEEAAAAAEEEIEEEQPEEELPELADSEIEEHVLHKDDTKKTITCKLCLEKIQMDEEEALTKHLEDEGHKSKFETYKEKCKGYKLVGIYVTCELCDREMAYDEWDYHQDTDRHNLNKLLVENGVDALTAPYAVIQKQVDENNTIESPFIGLFWLQEIIDAKTIDDFKIRYACNCCRITEAEGKTMEEIVEHIKTTKHIINAIEKHHKDVYNVCKLMVDTFNRSRPVTAKPRKLEDEVLTYIKDNGKEFFRRLKIKTKIILGEDHIRAIKAKYGCEKVPHEVLKNAKVELEPDLKAKIQDEMDRCRRPIVGLNMISERQYLNGDLEYFCILCHEEVKTANLTRHLAGKQHKKKFLSKYHPDEYKKISDQLKWVEGISNDAIKERRKKADEQIITICANYLDKYPRPQVLVGLKAGKSMPLFKNKKDDMAKKGGRKRRMGNERGDGMNEGPPPNKRWNSSGGGTRGHHGGGRGGSRGGGGFRGGHHMDNRGYRGRDNYDRGYSHGGRDRGYAGYENRGYGGGGGSQGGGYDRGYGGESGGYGGGRDNYGGDRGYDRGYGGSAGAGYNDRERGYSGGGHWQESERWGDRRQGDSGAGGGGRDYRDVEMVERISFALAKQMMGGRQGGSGSGRGGGSGAGGHYYDDRDYGRGYGGGGGSHQGNYY
ncbi:uncharacterized protein LOC141904031 [Tubulanus polymorphus]|uniref:uncharacterized protein LOC141904031 n=1 Tax=Tubulanus polymorphus TaxID=672921 RepID=UPI003DA58A55